MRVLLPVAQRGASLIYMPQVGLRTLPKRCISDLDGTLIRNELLIDLARSVGIGAEFEALTYATIGGSLGFIESLSRRAQLLRGVEVSALSTLSRSIVPAEGLDRWLDWCARHGIGIDLATGNFEQICLSLRALIPFEHYCASQAEVECGRLTGRLVSIADADAKARFCLATAQAHGLSPSELIAIGDGANDIPMLSSVGHACIYHGHEREGVLSIAIAHLIDLIEGHCFGGERSEFV